MIKIKYTLSEKKIRIDMSYISNFKMLIFEIQQHNPLEDDTLRNKR